MFWTLIDWSANHQSTHGHHHCSLWVKTTTFISRSQLGRLYKIFVSIGLNNDVSDIIESRYVEFTSDARQLGSFQRLYPYVAVQSPYSFSLKNRGAYQKSIFWLRLFMWGKWSRWLLTIRLSWLLRGRGSNLTLCRWLILATCWNWVRVRADITTLWARGFILATCRTRGLVGPTKELWSFTAVLPALLFVVQLLTRRVHCTWLETFSVLSVIVCISVTPIFPVCVETVHVIFVVGASSFASRALSKSNSVDSAATVSSSEEAFSLETSRLHESALVLPCGVDVTWWFCSNNSFKDVSLLSTSLLTFILIEFRNKCTCEVGPQSFCNRSFWWHFCVVLWFLICLLI